MLSVKFIFYMEQLLFLRFRVILSTTLARSATNPKTEPVHFSFVSPFAVNASITVPLALKSAPKPTAANFVNSLAMLPYPS